MSAQPIAQPPSRLRIAALGRPMLIAIAAINAITGLFAAIVLVPLSFGGDVDIYRRGAEGIAHGVIATDWLYAPLAGLLAMPLAWMPLTAAALTMSAIGLAILLGGVVLETRGMAWVDRVLVAIAALGFLPVVNELVLGQVTMLVAAAIYVLRDRDGFERGIPLGIVLALIPKPLLLPLLVWMLVRRRRALMSSAVTAAVVTAAGLVLLGTQLYTSWVQVLLGAGDVERQGNLALSSLGLGAPGWVIVALVAVGVLWAIVRDERRGFVAALLGAMLAQPYTLMYAASILLLAVRPAAAVAPLATRIFALTANLALLGAFLAWAGAALLAVLPWPGRKPKGPAPGEAPSAPASAPVSTGDVASQGGDGSRW